MRTFIRIEGLERIDERLRSGLIDGIPHFRAVDDDRGEPLTFGYINASWTLRADLTAQYVCRLLNHMDRHGHRVVYPKADASVKAQPFMSLSSGYVQRAQAHLPKQGSHAPWQVKSNYLYDLLTLRLARLEDGVITFEK